MRICILMRFHVQFLTGKGNELTKLIQLPVLIKLHVILQLHKNILT